MFQSLSMCEFLHRQVFPRLHENYYEDQRSELQVLKLFVVCVAPR